MKTRAKATSQHVKRVRATGKAYLKNQEDFPRVVLEYGRALLEARKACGDDDSAFGAWLATYHLDHVLKNDRAALINLAKYSKVAAKVLRETTSRSVRLIWEEVKPQVCKGTYPSAGTGRNCPGAC
jgi:hypothetical protein